MKRWPLVAALAYVALLVAALAIVPTGPDITRSGHALVRYYGEHGGDLRLAAWLTTWSIVPFVLLMARLRSALVGVGRDVMLFGAIGFVATGAVWTWLGAGLALHPATLQPSVARTVADIAAYFGPILTVFDVLIAVPIGIAAWQGVGGLPRWLAWISAVFALEQAIETVTIFGRHGFTAAGGDMNFQLGAGLLVVWVIAAGVAASNVHELRGDRGDAAAR